MPEIKLVRRYFAKAEIGILKLKSIWVESTPSKNAENKLNSHIFIWKMAIYSSRYNKSSGAHFAIFNSFENYRLGVTIPSYYFPNLKIPQALWFIYYANTFQIRKIVCMLFFAASKGNPSILRDPDS